MNPEIEKAAALIRSRGDRDYAVGIVLGSGLGRVADLVTDPVRWPYHDVPGFPVSKVSAHKNELIAGFIATRSAR
jgi:purine-nucleoside phosphorylase